MGVYMDYEILGFRAQGFKSRSLGLGALGLKV